MARPKGARNKKTAEMVERFDYLQAKYQVCPVEFLFQCVADALPCDLDPDGNEIQDPLPIPFRAFCADKLLPYRFPKRTALVNADTNVPIQLLIDMSGDEPNSLQLQAAPAAG